MIVEKTFYGIECDMCGCMFASEDNSYFLDADSAYLFANDNGWTEKDSKDYCENCSEKEVDEDE